MFTVLVLVPMKPNLHPLLQQKASELLSRLPDANPSLALEVVTDDRGEGDAHIRTLNERVAHTAKVRQAMVDDYLKPNHDFVLWIDADIVAYPETLPTDLIAKGDGHVAAPFVYLHGHGTRFYDLAGFVERGQWFNPQPPYCTQSGPICELDSVGCVVLFPASVYRQGGRHGPCNRYTDWLGVCRRARELGYKVLALRELAAYHADLKKYGEQYH